MFEKRLLLATTLGAALLVSLPAGAHPTSAPVDAVTVVVDASMPVGRKINRNLVGVDWKLGTGSAVNDLHPNLARADIAFQIAAKENGSFDWSFAESWVAEAQAAGAKPMLILNYMPPWLAATYPGDPRDPTRLPPRDFERWEQIVYQGVKHFAGQPWNVRFFEVWNEPDWAGFWQDTPAAFLETARRTALAVRQVEREMNIDLQFGGPGCLFPDPGCLVPWLVMMRELDMKPDFVSWHYYGNYPFIGPDGTEPSTPDPLYTALGHTNPAGGVALFPRGIEVVRAATTTALAGTGWEPELILDEWNVSAGGFDLRNDTHEGAAFDAGVLTEFQRAGLDRAAFFISKDAYIDDPQVNPSGEEFLGDWGLVSWKDSLKPAWWTFWLWGQMADEEIATTGTSAEDGFWAIASRDADRVTILLASFLTTGPHDHRVKLEVIGVPAGPLVAKTRRLDGAHFSAGIAETRTLSEPSVVLTLPPNSVLFVELRPTGSDG